MHNKSFYLFISSLGGGVAFRSFFNLGLSFLGLVILISLVVALIDRKFLILSISLVLFSLGALRMDVALERDFILIDSVGREAEITGIVIDEPSKRENSLQLKVKIEGSDERVLITTERASIFQYGDLISIKGVVRAPENFTTDNNREFDYINYLGKDDVFYQMLFPQIEIIESGHGNFFKEKLFVLKGVLISKMNKVISSPESEYLSGLIFGVKESLGKELEENFRRTGLIHVVVLSGYNVTIVANSILKVFSFLPQYVGLSFGIVSIVFFALMTGGSATIVRASIMAILAIIGKASGRTYGITRALFLAGILMILHNPKILIFDPSFQLSFMATLGLIHLSPVLANKMKFLPEKYQIRELAASTLATQIFVLPLLLNMIGEMSIIAPVTNLLVLPIVPVTMFFGFLTSVAGLVSNFLSTALGLVSFILLTYQINIVEFFGNLPFVTLPIKTFPVWLMLLVYLLYFWLYKRRKSI
jgi:competence protein ComEC